MTRPLLVGLLTSACLGMGACITASWLERVSPALEGFMTFVGGALVVGAQWVVETFCDWDEGKA